MINDHDLALLAQLADGTIDAADEPAARALLDTSAEARAEYDAQLNALAALREAGPARLTPAERTALRESLIAQLGLETAPEPEPARRRWSVSWGGLAVAAAALVGVLALAPLLSLLSTEGGDAASDTIADAFGAPATDAPAAAEDSASLMAEQLAPAAEESPLGDPPAADTTVAAATVPPVGSLLYDALPYLGVIEADDLALLEFGLLDLTNTDAAAWRLSLAGRPGVTDADEPLLDRFFARDGCTNAIPPGFSGEAVALAEISGVTVIVYRLASEAGGEGPSLLLLELDTCVELAGTTGG